MSDLWTRIEREIETRGWNLREFGQKIGESSQNINNWKKRGIPPSAHGKIAKALGKTADWCLGVEDDQAPSSASKTGLEPLSTREIELLQLFRAASKSMQEAVFSILEEATKTEVARGLRKVAPQKRKGSKSK